MRISSLQLRDLDTKKFSTQSSQILSIFFFPFIFIGQRVDTTLKIILTKNIKSAGMFNQQKCWLKVLKCLWTSLIFIHASAKIYVSILSSYCALRNWLFLHTYASSKKNFTLFGSWVQSCLKFAFFPNFNKIDQKRIKKSNSDDQNFHMLNKT